MENDVLTTREAARYLSLGASTLERFRISGGGPCYRKLGRAVRYHRSDLNEWLESRRTRSTSQAA